MEFVGKHFENTSVMVDGNVYRNCHFVNCNMIFCANGAPWKWENNTMERCAWQLEQAARSTLTFLYFLALAPNTGEEMLKKLFDNLSNLACHTREFVGPPRPPAAPRPPTPNYGVPKPPEKPYTPPKRIYSERELDEMMSTTTLQ